MIRQLYGENTDGLSRVVYHRMDRENDANYIGIKQLRERCKDH